MQPCSNSPFQPSRFRVGIKNVADYSPFGVQLNGRTISTTEYRIGFQNQEKDDEIKGEGNSVNYKYRMHDPRVGRFFAVDPLAAKYPHNSVYAFSENKLLDGIELEGLEQIKFTKKVGNLTHESILRPATDEEIKLYSPAMGIKPGEIPGKDEYWQIKTYETSEGFSKGKTYFRKESLQKGAAILRHIFVQYPTEGIIAWEAQSVIGSSVETHGPIEGGRVLVGTKLNFGPINNNLGVELKETSPESVSVNGVNENSLELNPQNWKTSPSIKIGAFLEMDLNKGDGSTDRKYKTEINLGPISMGYSIGSNGSSQVLFGFGLNIANPVETKISGTPVSAKQKL